jgi:hypothetical protein
VFAGHCSQALVLTADLKYPGAQGVHCSQDALVHSSPFEHNSHIWTSCAKIPGSDWVELITLWPMGQLISL